MMRQVIGFLVILSMSSAAAHAGSVFEIDLVADVSGGMVPAGEQVEFDVLLTQIGGEREAVRLIKLDFSQTDPAYSLDAWEWAYDGQLACTDFGSCGVGWTVNDTFPHVWTSNPGTESALLSMYIEGDATLTVGTLTVTTPVDLDESMVIDALNLPNADLQQGARLILDFLHPRDIRDFEGGTWTVPEPATLVLLLAGGAWVARRRR